MAWPLQHKLGRTTGVRYRGMPWARNPKEVRIAAFGEFLAAPHTSEVDRVLSRTDSFPRASTTVVVIFVFDSPDKLDAFVNQG